MHPADPLLKIGVVRKGSPDRVVTDGAQRVLGSQSGMATITQVMSGISVKLKEAIYLLGIEWFSFFYDTSKPKNAFKRFFDWSQETVDQLRRVAELS